MANAHKLREVREKFAVADDWNSDTAASELVERRGRIASILRSRQRRRFGTWSHTGWSLASEIFEQRAKERKGNTGSHYFLYFLLKRMGRINQSVCR